MGHLLTDDDLGDAAGLAQVDEGDTAVVAATRDVGLAVPLVVRLEGTNVEKGREILQASGLAITPAATMAEGAQKIVELASQKKGS